MIPFADPANKTEDEDVYARGLANYGLQTQQQMRHLHNQIHEPIYVGYSPDGHLNSSIYSTTSRSHTLGKKIPPKVPPKPSINALLGIGIVVPQSHGTKSNHGGSNTLPSRSNSTNEIYENTVLKRIWLNSANKINLSESSQTQTQLIKL